MIILDLQQIMLSNLMVGVQKHEIEDFSDDLFRHMVLNSIRSNLTKFRSTYGDLVIASDGIKYWRKDVFPNYKWHRQGDREKREKIDWSAVFESINKIRDELRDNFSYPVINLPHVEADDIIATLILNNTEDKYLILSADKDFVQLQVNPKVAQYDPIRKKAVKIDNPREYLLEHVIRGDRGDGIPNIRSGDDVFVNGQRQSVISKANAEKWIDFLSKDEDSSTQIFPNEVYRNWCRNRDLIDLTRIPLNVRQDILAEYENQKTKPPKSLTPYFMKHNLRQLLGAMGEF